MRYLFSIIALCSGFTTQAQVVSNYDYSTELTMSFRIGNYIYSAHKDSGLYQFDIQTQEQTLFRQSNSNLSNYPIRYIVTDRNGKAWFKHQIYVPGTDPYYSSVNFITEFDGFNFKTYLNSDLNLDPNYKIYSLYYDNVAGLLVSSSYKAIALKNEVVSDYLVYSKEGSRPLLVRAENTLMRAGVFGSNTEVYTNGVLQHVDFGIVVENVCNSLDKIYLAGDGLYIYDKGNVVSFGLNNSNIPYKYTNNVMSDLKNNIWLSFFDNSNVTNENYGFCRFTGTGFDSHFTTENSALSSDRIRHIERDELGNLILTTDKGVSIFNVATLGELEKEPVVLNVKLFPNPTTTNLEVSLSGEIGETINYTIVNSQGKVISQGMFQHAENNFNIDVRELTSGIYILTIQTDQTKFTKQFSKI
jgi:hypothetical protein